MVNPKSEQDPVKAIARCLAAEDSAGAVRNLREAARLGRLAPADQEDVLYRIAMTTDDRRVRDAAIDIYEAAVREGRDSGWLWERLGNLYLASGDDDAAIRAYRRVLESESLDGETRWPACCILADLLTGKGHAKKALDILRPAVAALAPSDTNAAPVFARMGAVHLALASPQAACRWYEKAMALDPNETAWPKELALGLEKLKRYDLALKYWAAVLAIPSLRMSDTVMDDTRPIFKVQEYMKDTAIAKAHKRSCEIALGGNPIDKRGR